MNIRDWLRAARLDRGLADSLDEGTGYFSIGRVTLDFSLLKSVVRRRGYLMPFDPVLASGGGGYARRGRLLVGGRGEGGGGALEDEHHRTGYGYGTGALTYGYLVHDTEHVRLYPYAGVGGLGAGLSVEPHDRVASRAPYPSAGTGGPAFNIGWALECRIPLLPKRFLVVGLHAGVWITPLRLGWYGRGERLPRTRLVKPYFKLLLGASWTR